MIESFLDGRVILHPGDCLDVLARLEECSIDSCVTDPPYHLTSIVKRFGMDDAAPCRPFKSNLVRDPGTLQPVTGRQSTSQYGRLSTGFMGKQWDGGDIAFRVETWAAVYRVLKPGAHLLAFSGTRTYHRMACAIEDAGFEIRDCIQWLYGSGFPKSHDVSKGIDRAAGAEREKIRTAMGPTGNKYCKGLGDGRPWMELAAATGFHEHDSDKPATFEAAQWEGWGTALKPACEIIVLARKLLSEPTIAANVLRWGTGAINVGACRVEYQNEADKTAALTGDAFKRKDTSDKAGWSRPWMDNPEKVAALNAASKARAQNGRWPANVLLDGSPEVVGAFPDGAPPCGSPKLAQGNGGIFGGGAPGTIYSDSGSAARFFYQARTNDIEQVVITWISESEPCQATLLVDMGQLPGRATVASASVGGNGWSTFLSGNTLTDLFRQASMCTIKTATNSTIESRIWNYLISLLTSEFTGAVKCETVNGGSLAESADKKTQSLIFTLARTVSLPGASLAASGTQLKISVSAATEEQLNSTKRFWYGSKADADDRLGARHPTIKPLDLMQYLVRLVTPPRGTVLDLFSGTGTTGEAAYREGMRAVLIEREAEYQDDIRRRMALVLAGPDERVRESVKAKNLPRDDGPLFGGRDVPFTGRTVSAGFEGEERRKRMAATEADVDNYKPRDDFNKSINVCYEAIRERVAKGGEGWKQK